MNRRAAVFFYDGYLGVSPSVVGTLTALIDLGYEIDLFMAQPLIPTPPVALAAGVRVHQIRPWTRFFSDLLITYLKRRGTRREHNPSERDRAHGPPSRLKAFLRALTFLVELPILILYCAPRIKSPDLIFVFDVTSLLMAWPFAQGKPIVYWGLETRPLSEMRDPISRYLKKFELSHLNRMAAVVTPGPARTLMFSREQDLTVSVFHIPNAPYSDEAEADDGRFFRDRFDIADDKIVVLHAGMITPAFLSREIAAASVNWPARYTLIFHERQKRDATEPYVASVGADAEGHAFLSLDPLPFEAIGRAYTGANIGLVAYDASEANMVYAWASSGKLSYYLKYGLPVVFVTPERPAMLEKWGFGLWTPNADGIGAALDEIHDRYDAYRDAAQISYRGLFDFKSAFLDLHACVVHDVAHP